ncbi:hypothetical protein Tco_0099095, partial [Tanacetum coccineum]
MISQDLATHVPKMIEDLFKQHMESITSNVFLSSKASIASIFDLQHQLYMKMKRNIQSQIDDFVIWGGLQDKFGTSLVSPSTCRPHASRHHDHGDYRHDNPKGGKILRSTTLALVLLSLSEENKNIDGFGFVS